MAQNDKKIKELQRLIEKGKKRGYLTFDEVDAVLPSGASVDVSRSQLATMFENMEIAVLEEDPEDNFEEDDFDEEEEVVAPTGDGKSYEPSAGDLDDPIKIYFREMGEKPLLDREGEIRLARGIEEGQEGIVKSALNCPVASEYLLEIRDDIRSGALPLEEVRRDAEELADERATIRTMMGIVTKVKNRRHKMRSIRSKLNRRLRDETELKVRLELIEVQAGMATLMEGLNPT